MRNIRRPQSEETLFKRFTEAAHPASKKPIFATQRDFLCFLAVLGYNSGERTPITGKTTELDSRVFEGHEQSRDILYLIALAGAKDANILQPENEDQMVKIFEEYVASGFKVLDRWLKECPDDHIGDQAIITSIRKEGFFGSHVTSIEKAIGDVVF